MIKNRLSQQCELKTVSELIGYLTGLIESDLSQTDFTETDLSDGQQKLADLTVDSRMVKTNDCFIALQGERVHGLDFLATILVKNPAFILSDKALNAEQKALLTSSQPTCAVFVLKNLASYLAALANWFYDQPSQRIKVVGITGTNGKTSTAFYTAQLLDSLGEKTALIGTLGNGLYQHGVVNSLTATLNTTPDVVTVYRLLAEFIEQGALWVVMEVSSHALELGRVSGVEFETVAFTQITRDHIDFHGSVEAYQQAKSKLFTEYASRHQVLNTNDVFSLQLVQADLKDIWTYAIKGLDTYGNKAVNLSCDKLELNVHGMALLLKVGLSKLAQDHEPMTSVPLMGAFNVENVLCALSIVLVSHNELEQKERWTKLSLALTELQSVEGRMQQIQLSSQESNQPPQHCPTVIVDFAHTPDALEQVLVSVKQHLTGGNSGDLWVLFGCGGDRDQGKRPLMASVAESIADKVMVTSDNPRFENTQQIITQIMTGFDKASLVAVEPDREKAILGLLSKVKQNDIVVIAGKGHERYQDIKGVKTPFNDAQIALDWMKQNGG